MKYEIRFCEKCKKYTMNEECCNQKTVSSEPPKFSPDDKYAKYRLRIKKEEWGLSDE